MQIYSKEERVKYLDVDKNNQLSNKALVNYMQDMAVCHADSLGNGVNNAAETHTAWLLLNWKIRVFDRPKCEDIIKKYLSRKKYDGKFTRGLYRRGVI